MSLARRLARLLAAAAIAATAAIVPVALTGTPAEAGYVSTVVTTSSPVTWVDSQGRQLMIASSTNTSIRVARDTPSGDPDLTWGAYGIRTVTFALPAGAVATSIRIAPDDDGVLTLFHHAADCAGALPCDRWFQRIDGSTGATVAGPVLVEDLPPSFRALDDGSLLLGSTGTALAWYGPDGAERAALPVLETEFVHADVDAAGRLLILTTDGVVHRFDPDGGPVLEVDTPCDPIPSPPAAGAVGASSAAPGFGVACSVSSGPPTALRYADDGTLAWTRAGSAAGPGGSVTDVTVTADGRVWVASRISNLFPWILDGTGRVTATPASSAGWGDPKYQRATGAQGYTDIGGGVAEMRPVGDGDEVAVADLQVCCRYPNNTSPQMAAHSAIVPYRPGPPICSVSAVALSSAGPGDLTVGFRSCPAGVPAIRRPTSYRVDLTVDGTTRTGSVDDTGTASDRTVSFDGVADGAFAKVLITPVNDEGGGLLDPIHTETTTPFTSVQDFVGQQVRDLYGPGLPAPIEAGHVSAIAGGAPPGPVLEQLITGGGTPHESVEPVSRIYRAAFLRDPDTGGLRYWYGKHRGGTRIATMAEQFARSSEFRRRYGSLSHGAFVRQIYQNVLGRPGDTAGIAFWTKRLTSGRATRGAVLANFSESSELVRTTRTRVATITVTFLMLGRRPTAAELSTWTAADDVYGTMPSAVLATAEYAQRIRNR